MRAHLQYRSCILGLLSAFAFGLASSSTSASQNTPLYPEDGSMRVTHWTSSQRLRTHIADGPRFKAAFEAEGVIHRVIPGQFSYLQDLGFFDEVGRWISNAPYKDILANPDHFFGLTLDVANEDWGPVYIKPEDAEKAGLKVSRQMKITFEEGGALLSGRRANGEPYVITSQRMIERAMAFSRLSLEETQKQVADDLAVSPKNLIVLKEVPSHLDLFILLLPNAQAMVDDPRLRRHVLERALEIATDPKEIARLKALKSQELDPHRVRQLNSISETLETHGIKVFRAAGTFQETPESEERRRPRVVNFFNGFHGIGSSGKRFLMTNHANGLQSLERYWSETYSKLAGTDSERVYFLAAALETAGLDCLGLPSRSLDE